MEWNISKLCDVCFGGMEEMFNEQQQKPVKYYTRNVTNSIFIAPNICSKDKKMINRKCRDVIICE